MPWCEIPPEKLGQLGLFGYDIVFQDEEFIWAHGPIGRVCISKVRPWVWFEDVGEAVQAGAISVISTPE